MFVISLDSCRYDTFESAYSDGSLPRMAALGPLHKALAPSHFTFGSHAAFWMGFTPGVIGCSDRWLNPKAGKLFRMAFAGHPVGTKIIVLKGPILLRVSVASDTRLLALELSIGSIPTPKLSFTCTALRALFSLAIPGV